MPPPILRCAGMSAMKRYLELAKVARHLHGLFAPRLFWYSRLRCDPSARLQCSFYRPRPFFSSSQQLSARWYSSPPKPPAAAPASAAAGKKTDPTEKAALPHDAPIPPRLSAAHLRQVAANVPLYKYLAARSKYFLVRTRKWTVDDLLGLMSWLLLSHVFIAVFFTTAFAMLLLWLANSLGFQGDLLRH